ncbi:MAG: hypothetical protein U9532_03115 ['Conium maculatum' witches'-broom phytoplasma]|nr:hypothetical protein ['Conium maculatum' witches'-broom phytoplasma]
MKTFKQKAKKLCQNKKISAGASFLIILLLAMYVLPSQNPYESSDESLLTSSWDHLLGTDTSGFDFI